MPLPWSRQSARALPTPGSRSGLYTPALTGHVWGFSLFPGPWQKVGPSTGAHPPPMPALHVSTTATLLSGALLGLTVTFLPERPAGPILAEVGLPAKGLPPSLQPHMLSRHKDQRSDGFSLSPAALGGGGLLNHSDEKSPAQPPPPPPTPQQPELYTGCSLGLPTTHQSPTTPLALSSELELQWAHPSFLSLPLPLSAYLAPALQLQPLGKSSLPPPSSFPLPPSTPVSARCLLSVRLQSSPGDRRTMLKAFSQF